MSVLPGPNPDPSERRVGWRGREAAKAAQEAAEAAMLQERQQLRARERAGKRNINWPAGTRRGVANHTLTPPLFRTSLTASEAKLGLGGRHSSVIFRVLSESGEKVL